MVIKVQIDGEIFSTRVVENTIYERVKRIGQYMKTKKRIIIFERPQETVKRLKSVLRRINCQKNK